MKQCPHCKKNIPDSAKVCPYCGTPLVKGYKPMKRTNAVPNYVYIFFVLLLIFSPVISSLIFGDVADGTTANKTPEEAITLAPLGKVDLNEEIIEYQFDSLKDFDKLVTNSDKYVKKIKELEADLKDVVSKYGKAKIKKDYVFYVTDQNNVYTNLVYDIILKQETVSIEYSYDLSGKTNNVSINYSINGLKDFNSMKVTDNSYGMYKDLITFVDGDKDYSLFNQVASKFNELESDFVERSDSLGNYGLGVNDSSDGKKAAMRILNGKDGYRLKLTYRSKANMKKLV